MFFASSGRLNLLELLAMLLIERVRSRDAGVPGGEACMWTLSKAWGRGDGNGSPQVSGVELPVRSREVLYGYGGSEAAVGGVGGGR